MLSCILCRKTWRSSNLARTFLLSLGEEVLGVEAKDWPARRRGLFRPAPVAGIRGGAEPAVVSGLRTQESCAGWARGRVGGAAWCSRRWLSRACRPPSCRAGTGEKSRVASLPPDLLSRLGDADALKQNKCDLRFLVILRPVARPKSSPGPLSRPAKARPLGRIQEPQRKNS